ncbi:MAG: carboxypeptidase M32 [Acholeplasmatales bacterium]
MKEKYLSFRKKINAYSYALWLLSWDAETESPSEAHNYRVRQMEVLHKENYRLLMSKERIETIEALLKEEKLDALFKRELELEKKSIDRIKKIPEEEYLKYQTLIQESMVVWKKAKEESNFKIFEDTLDEIITYNKKLIKYLETDTLKGYNVLLDMYEENMTIRDYDMFFNTLNKELVPFVLEVAKNKRRHPKVLTHGNFDKDLQRKFNRDLAGIFNYDLNKGVIKESVHPFTSGLVSVDTRITTAYHNNIDSAIFSTIHEMGHAIYEQQVNHEFDGTALSGGVSMGIHESQSRFYENIIGRGYAFWETHYSKLREYFPVLKRVSLEEFYAYINRVKCDFIRIDSDELTYSLHIMVRYEIEKQIFNGNLKTKDIPKLWNKLYKEYLGVNVKKDSLGALQDIHWSMGSFGYFPTYALGSAIAAQLYYEMEKDFNVKLAIKEGKISKINDWLKEKIHKYGRLHTPKELLMIATKEPFNPKYYIRYLKEKFRDLYEIN